MGKIECQRIYLIPFGYEGQKSGACHGNMKLSAQTRQTATE